MIRVFSTICLLFISSNLQAKKMVFVGAKFPQVLESNKEELSGISVDLLNMIMKRLYQEFEIKIYPWKRALIMLENGQADGIIGPYKSKERQRFLNYSRYPFYEDNLYIYKKNDNSFEWKGDYSKLRDRRVGIIRGWTYGENFNSNKKNLDLSYVSNANQGGKMLSADRVEFMIAHPRSLTAFCKRDRDLKKIVPMKNRVTTNEGYFAFAKNKDLEKFVNKFDQEFKKIIDNGTLKQLQHRHELD